MLDRKPAKIPAACLSATQPLMASEQSDWLVGGLPVLMEGEQNSNHV